MKKAYTANNDIQLNENNVFRCEDSQSPIAVITSVENKPEKEEELSVHKGEANIRDGPNVIKSSTSDSNEPSLTSEGSMGLHPSAFQDNFRLTLENQAVDTVEFELPLTLRILFMGSGASGEDKELILEKISHSLSRLFEPSPTSSQTLSDSSTLPGSKREFGVNYVVLPMSVLLGRDDLRNSVVRYEDSGVYIQVGDFIDRNISDALQYIQSLEDVLVDHSLQKNNNVVDVCFYFVTSLISENDINAMMVLSQQVNVVPIIVGTEALGVDEIVGCRRSILETLERNDINIKSFTDSHVLLTHGWLKIKGEICGETILTTTEFTLLDSQCVYNRILGLHADALKSATKKAIFVLNRSRRKSIRWLATLMFVVLFTLWILLPIPGLDVDPSEETMDNSTSEFTGIPVPVPVDEINGVWPNLVDHGAQNLLSVSTISKLSTELSIHTLSKGRPKIPELNSKLDIQIFIVNKTEQHQPGQTPIFSNQTLVDTVHPHEPIVQPTGPISQAHRNDLDSSLEFHKVAGLAKIQLSEKTTNIPHSDECTTFTVQCLLSKVRSIGKPIRNTANFTLQIRSEIRSVAISTFKNLGSYVDSPYLQLDWYVSKLTHYRANVRQKIITKIHLGMEFMGKIYHLSERLGSKLTEMRKSFKERISHLKRN
ncbi:hypothetical protein K7432_004327 [Basidiobolus ranarum]